MRERLQSWLEQRMPMGIDRELELRWIRNALILSFAYSLTFFLTYIQMYNGLFEVRNEKKMMKPGAIMVDFADMLDNRMGGFLIVALAMVALLIYHYAYHYQGSKSIYLMRRLPDRNALWRRCVTVPASVAAISLCMAAILLLLFFAFYMVVTPETCLAPGQWQKIWSVGLG